MENNSYDFRILTIDDNIAIHKDFEKILSNNKTVAHLEFLDSQLFDVNEAPSDIQLPEFKIDTATQGKEGVEKIAQAIKQGKPYALAFVDIRMPPGWDGIETIKHIWKLDNSIQIVICTAHSDYSWEETIKQLGQTDNLLILKKPFDSIAVRQLACALTRKWRLMQELSEHTKVLEQTIRKRTQELEYLATHDALTGLPNKALIYDRIEHAIHNAKRKNTRFAVLFIDLDRFKLINDSISHKAGDEVLAIVAQRIRSKIRASDTVGRFGGDEFIIILENLDTGISLSHIVDPLLTALNERMSVNDQDMTISGSIGIAIYPDNGNTLEELICNADMAMYKSKGLGGNQFQYHSTEANRESMHQHLTMEAELRQAVAKKEFRLFYQAQYDTKSETLMAVEALVRWVHPEKGIILPLDFIPLAEETGLIIPLGEWILNEACKQNYLWQEAGLPKIRMAVNITARQLRQPGFVKTVQDALEQSGLQPEYLELELSENAITTNIAAHEIVTTLKKTGVRIAIGDFGTGYTGMNYLKKLPLDRLKIDKSFVENIHINPSDEVLIKAIIEMAHGLNMNVLAEGVENIKQLKFLTSRQCYDIQGYYFNKPLLPDEMVKIMKKQPKAPPGN